ncbi:MAG: hypothetical protein R8M11_07550 [Gallionella sp.]
MWRGNCYNNVVAEFFGSISTGATFAGQYDSDNALSGTWSNSILGGNGSFTGARVAGLRDAQARITGHYTGGDEGVFSLDVDANNNISGIAYSIVSDTDDSFFGTVTETATGGIINATSASGVVITGTATLINPTDRNFAIQGTWIALDGTSGIFAGAGCVLNN